MSWDGFELPREMDATCSRTHPRMDLNCPRMDLNSPQDMDPTCSRTDPICPETDLNCPGRWTQPVLEPELP